MGLKGAERSANPGDVSTCASTASERAQRAAGAEREGGFRDPIESTNSERWLT